MLLCRMRCCNAIGAAPCCHTTTCSFFPPDVRYVADHAKRAMSRFPSCDGFYYGVDYRRDMVWWWCRFCG